MQKYQVLISELAEREIREIDYFISETVSAISASKVTNRIWRTIFALEFFPRRGTRFEPAPNIWMVPVKKYKYYIIYEVDEKTHTVIVHHVIHQHRDLGRIFW